MEFNLIQHILKGITIIISYSSQKKAKLNLKILKFRLNAQNVVFYNIKANSVEGALLLYKTFLDHNECSINDSEDISFKKEFSHVILYVNSQAIIRQESEFTFSSDDQSEIYPVRIGTQEDIEKCLY